MGSVIIAAGKQSARAARGFRFPIAFMDTEQGAPFPWSQFQSGESTEEQRQWPRSLGASTLV
jgi:hypothetical protein